MDHQDARPRHPVKHQANAAMGVIGHVLSQIGGAIQHRAPKLRGVREIGPRLVATDPQDHPAEAAAAVAPTRSHSKNDPAFTMAAAAVTSAMDGMIVPAAVTSK